MAYGLYMSETLSKPEYTALKTHGHHPSTNANDDVLYNNFKVMPNDVMNFNFIAGDYTISVISKHKS